MENLVILDFTRIMAGPYCTQILGDMGAQVIKVEEIGGENSRKASTKFVRGQSPMFLALNRNKKSISLNLKAREAVEIVKKFAAKCDVLVEGFRPGVMDRMGLGYSELCRMNPRLVYCSISGYGQTGPYKDWPGQDLLIQGMGGIMSVTGEPGGPPLAVGAPVCDILGALLAVNAIMFALYEREKSNLGQRVAISLLDGQLALQAWEMTHFLNTGEIAPKAGGGHGFLAPYGTFHTKDEDIVLVGGVSFWPQLCRGLGREDLFRDSRFDTLEKRVQNRTLLNSILQQILATKIYSEWHKIFLKHNVLHGKINTYADLEKDPQVKENKMIAEVEHNSYGKIRMPGIPLRLYRTPGDIKSPPPLAGEHTDELLGRLGYGKSDIEELRKSKIVG